MLWCTAITATPMLGYKLSNPVHASPTVGLLSIFSLLNAITGLYSKTISIPKRRTALAKFSLQLKAVSEVQDKIQVELNDLEIVISKELRDAFYNEDLYELKSLLAEFTRYKQIKPISPELLYRMVARSNLIVSKLSQYEVVALPAYLTAVNGVRNNSSVTSRHQRRRKEKVYRA